MSIELKAESRKNIDELKEDIKRNKNELKEDINKNNLLIEKLQKEIREKKALSKRKNLI